MSSENVKINSEDKSISLNKYNLLGAYDDEISERYNAFFNSIEGSLTTVSDNDAVTKIDVAIANLKLNETQQNILDLIKNTFSVIEKVIDPTRLIFTVSQTEDDEICLTRFSELGVSKIIISDDGIIAYSFIAYNNIPKDDVLDFYSFSSDTDLEKISYTFFSL